MLHDFEAAVDAAIDEMPEDFAIRAFLLANRAEVRAMLLTEYDKERELELLRLEERREAKKELRQEVLQEVRQEVLQEVQQQVRQEVRQETETEVNERVAKKMLVEKLPLELIKKVSSLSETHIRRLAKNLGVAVL